METPEKIAARLARGNEWVVCDLGVKKKRKCPLYGNYQAHIIPKDEKQADISIPKKGEVITESSDMQSNSIITTPFSQDTNREVTPHCKDKPAATGEEHIRGNLTYLGWSLFLIGILSVGWYLWKNMVIRRNTTPIPIPYKRCTDMRGCIGDALIHSFPEITISAPIAFYILQCSKPEHGSPSQSVQYGRSIMHSERICRKSTPQPWIWLEEIQVLQSSSNGYRFLVKCSIGMPKERRPGSFLHLRRSHPMSLGLMNGITAVWMKRMIT